MSTRRATWAAAVLTLAVVAGCGSKDSEPVDAATEPTIEASPTPTSTSTPTAEVVTCATIWVQGEELPRPYKGCRDAEADRWVKANVQHCSSGQRIVTFANSFYAVPGRRIVMTSGPLRDDADYAQLIIACTA